MSKLGGATHQQQSIPEYQQQTLTEQHQVPVQTSASTTPQPTQHVQAQVQQAFVSQEVATPQAVDWSAQIADVMRNQFGLKPKKPTFMYRKPYPEAYIRLLYLTDTECRISPSSLDRT